MSFLDRFAPRRLSSEGFGALEAMKLLVFVICGLMEIIGAAEIVHFWRQRSSLLEKLYWSTILLLPVFGLLFYLFINVNPEPHGHNPTGGPWG